MFITQVSSPVNNFLSAETLAGVFTVAGLQIVQDLFYFPGTRYAAVHAAVAESQEKKPHHGRCVGKLHAPLQTEEGFFPVMALRKEPVQLRISCLKIRGVEFFRESVLAVITYRNNRVEALSQVLAVQRGRSLMFQPDVRLIPFPEDLMGRIR